ncbi:hypothetical protein ACR80T_23805, partial [Escherichia coli]|uniref:hypothetical protein n=1 Tax=Escherichia coli TaxID=562 RepID=UPI0040595A19
MDVDVSTSVAGNKPQRIRRIQTVTLVLLFMAGIVYFFKYPPFCTFWGRVARGVLIFRNLL